MSNRIKVKLSNNNNQLKKSSRKRLIKTKINKVRVIILLKDSC